MRLLSIKLSGFKSFADHTVIEISRQLVGVVGPNGCGKSNIIDAVRWVLGESRASELRGEGMQSVIFAGSQQRHAVSRASVELLFDNHPPIRSDEWSHYAEICVKHVVTKQGDSLYFINNQAVRRRDVAELFAGTGLRAYAIVGQGTVSKILEARPSDVRELLEEAAGVGRYRDKKREAENRLNDARENMQRVEVVAQQLAEQEKHLAQQALCAQQYLDWTAALRDVQIRILAVKYQRVHAALQKDQDHLRSVQQAVRAKNEQCAECTARAIRGREEKDVLYTVLCNQQERVYQLRATLLQYQDLHRHQSDLKAHWSHQWQTCCEQLQSTQQVLSALSMRDLDAQAACIAEEEQWQQHAASLASNTQESVLLQEQLAQVALCLEKARAVFVEQEREHHAASVQYECVCDELARVQTCLDQNVHEANGLVAPDEHALQECVDLLHQSQDQWKTAVARQREVTVCLTVCRRTVQEKQQQVHELAAILSHIDGKISTLENAHVVAGEEGLSQWLVEHQLEDCYQCLWSLLQVHSNWVTAVEVILRERLQAIAVEDLTTAMAFFPQRPPTSVVFYEKKNHVDSFAQWSQIISVQDVALAAVVSGWLSAYDPVLTWQEALEKRATLADGRCFILPTGDIVSCSSIVLLNPHSEQIGFLSRSQEITQLKQERVGCQQAWQVANDALQCLCADLAMYEKENVVAQYQLQECVEHVHTFEKKQLLLEQEQVRFTDSVNRHRKNGDDWAKCHQALCDEKMVAQQKCATLACSLASSTQSMQEQQQQYDTLRLFCDGRLTALHGEEKKSQEYQSAVREKKMQLQDIEKETAFYQKHRVQLLETQSTVDKELALLQDVDTIAQDIAKTEAQLVDSEQAWQASAAQLAEYQHGQQQIDQEQAQYAQEHLTLKEQEQSLILRIQEHQLGLSQIDEQCVASLGADQDVVRQTTETRSLHKLQNEMNGIQQQITSLGAVNLAAVEELAQIQQRKTYLLAQLDDLQAAVDTVQCAINKMDDNTRQVLRNVLQAVNEHLRRLFTVLFNGGEACLEMIGDDLLSAGLRIVAKPPGKKNHSIQMLSGGEKALTALALLFAMIALNPAPFCMLDEVDAPLDDVNAARLGRLIREMSTQTQMLFITHNKITMEIAQQLVGVTMQELGVSRIVGVDMEHIDQMIRGQSVQSVVKSGC